MCKSILEGGDRCPCDSSEARRLRRHNAKAINDYKPSVVQSKQKAPVKKPSSPPTKGSIEAVYTKIDDLRELRNLVDKFSYHRNLPEKMPVPSVTLSDGTVLDGRTDISELYVVTERLTTELGDNINALVEERTGFTDALIVETNKVTVEEAAKEVDEIVALRKEHSDKRDAMFPPLRDEDGVIVKTTNQLYFEARDNGDPDAIEWRKKEAELSERHVQAVHSLNLKKQGRDPETEKMMNTNREELVRILKDLRPIGGSINFAPKSNKEAVNALKAAESLYPSAWIEASNNRPAFIAKKTSRRAHYSDGSFQKSYKVVEVKNFTYKPEGWEPDPSNMHEVGSWHKTDEYGKWVDPDTGIEYSSHTEPGEVAWVYTPVEYYRSWNNEEQLTKPHGNGWQKAVHKETRYNYDTKQREEVGMRTYWYRPVKRRKLVEAKIQPEITVSGSGQSAVNTALHEFAHRVEASDSVGMHIKTLEETFLKRRTTDADGRRHDLVKLYPRTREFARPDDFVSAYMGKVYDMGYREVLSTGAEAVFGNNYGGLAGLNDNKSDRDMKNFIVGLWASA